MQRLAQIVACGVTPQNDVEAKSGQRGGDIFGIMDRRGKAGRTFGEFIAATFSIAAAVLSVYSISSADSG